MNDPGNLFATPDRPKLLRMSVERLWVAGDDVVSLSLATVGGKSPETVWLDVQQFTGPQWSTVVAARLEAAVSRWDSSLWAKPPKQTSYEGWLAT